MTSAGQFSAAINQKLASLGHAKQASHYAHTIFIGCGDAGKTSPIRALHSEPVVVGKAPMILGIQSQEWHGAGDNLATHFGPVGGQGVAHTPTSLFHAVKMYHHCHQR